ncbi:Fe-S cluster biogenesis protein NfuA, 4Fe-4S-binding domain [Methylobacterium sp. ap11]|uniref:NifU family protein n=1 Tax=Methylobacterium sp. ap11 TaxID=1761799 RepID=UPI0008C84578|nr:NifU family protein [Methylobacterium sp. ap11]SEP44836.1 Fe-S cluster biogenesis protein NfuA, 4Fe-4S-binding domain [Methylobacterium sp. ap11]
MFIQTEATPNPATLKFLPGKVVLQEGTFEARDEGAAARSPLARALFAVEGVSGVYLGHDFISVTKAEGEPGWPQVKPAVLGAIMEHFMSGAPVMEAGHAPEEAAEEFYDEADADTVVTIKDLLETRVRPAVAGDGGDITFRGFRDGVVYLEMKGACSGCPSSTATLRQGVQNLFRHFLPDVREVQAVS